MNQGQDRIRGAAPTDAEVARTIRSVPGVAEADVTRSPVTGRSRLRIRLKPGEDPERVAWAVAATLRERYDIALDPEAIRPRLSESPPAPEEAGRAAAEEATGPATDPRETGPAPAEEARGPASGEEPAGHVAPTEKARGPASGEEPAGQAAPAAEAPATAGNGAPAAEGTASDAAGSPAEPPATAEDDHAPRERPRRQLGLPTEETALWRAVIRHLSTRHEGLQVSVAATLEVDGRPATGQARAAPTTRGMHHGIAEATVRALASLTREPLRAQVDRVSVSECDPPTATVVISLLSGRGEELLLGGSIVRGDVEHAVMRATLDALNRRVQPDLAV